jgi:hypothetical protein
MLCVHEDVDVLASVIFALMAIQQKIHDHIVTRFLCTAMLIARSTLVCSLDSLV